MRYSNNYAVKDMQISFTTVAKPISISTLALALDFNVEASASASNLTLDFDELLQATTSHYLTKQSMQL